MENQNLTLRPETPADYAATEQLTYDVFKGAKIPGQTHTDEHLVLHNLRKTPNFVPELTMVALQNGTLVGHILYVTCTITAPDGTVHEVLTFGPLSVRPDLQGTGIGGTLVRHTLKKAAELGYKGVFIFGHTDYYPRFGFQNAETFGVTTADGKNFDAFMGLELAPGALAGIHGRLHLPAAYTVTDEEREAFNKDFFAQREP